MELFEQAVMGYLTHHYETFLRPQFSIGGGWAWPDFVALRPSQREVLIVEVCTARCDGLRDLERKVNDRNHQWIDKLKTQLRQHGIIDEQSTFVVKVFIRRDCVDDFKKGIQDPHGVEVVPLEDATFPWTWEWKT
jgi:hypothetical protein